MECPCCTGSGQVKNPESMAIEVLRKLILGSQQDRVARMTVVVSDAVAAYLNNKKRRELSGIEDDSSLILQIEGREDVSPEHLTIAYVDSHGRDVKFADAHAST